MVKERLYYLDWLRIGAFGLLIIFHCTRFFDFFPWHVKNSQQSEFVTQVFLFTTSWRMPLIFFVSGAGTFFALRSKRENFLFGRVKRLLIPYIFGILILIPPQKYYEFVHQSGEVAGYLQFLRIYPQQIFSAQNGLNLTWFGLLGYHIWYLPFLFVQTVLLIPLFRKAQKMHSLRAPSIKRLWLLFPVLIIINVGLRPVFPAYLDWADFLHFLFFFLLGFYFVKHRKTLTGQVMHHMNVMAGIALFTSLLTLYFALFTPYMIKWFDRPDFSIDYLGFLAVRAVNALSWVWWLLALSIKYLNKSHPKLKGLNDAVLPVYVLHQTFIIIIGFYVVQWEINSIAKFMLILSSSCLLMWAGYELIRRLQLLRFLFGMRKE